MTADEFVKLLIEATAEVVDPYFLLPVANRKKGWYRERVYCYELYHQMRLRWPADCVYRLNGEVDKIGHPYFQDAAAPKPDLLVHQPGHGNNYAIVEVKSCRVGVAGIRKDLTLSHVLEMNSDISGPSI